MSPPRMIYAAAVMAALWLLPAQAQANPCKARGGRPYVVRPGDSCWSIALRVMGKGEAYKKIHRHNDLGPMPHILKPGSLLCLPGKAAGPDALVQWTQRKVRAKTPKMMDWLQARKGMGLWRLYKVTTGSSSSAGIEFEDRSSLRMREKALLVIYGGSAARTRTRRDRGTTVVLERGTVRGGLASLDQQASLKLRTPSALVELRSRSAQVEVDPAKTSVVSVYDGKAEVSAQGARVTVPKDHGTFVKRGKRPAPPRPLPRAPAWATGIGDVVVLVPEGQPGTFEARWKRARGAARYRVELARDARFKIPVVDAVVGAGVRRFAARQMVLGEYYARVATIDSARLEGRPSRPIKIRVVRLQSSRLLRPRQDRVYQVVGLLRLQPMASKGIEVALGDGPFGPAAQPVRLSKPGLHTVRYRQVGQASSTQIKVRLLAVKGALVAPAGALEPGQQATLQLKVSDELGRPAALPSVALRATPGGLLKLSQLSAGTYGATFLAPAHPGGVEVILAARWAGGALGQTTLQVKAPPRPAPPPTPPAPPPPPEFDWPQLPVGLQGHRPGPGLPSRSARPVTHLGLGAVVAGSPREPDQEVMLRLALRSGLALLGGRLGLDLDLPWFHADVTEDRAGGSDLGDIRLGARFLALDASGLRLTPTLRVSTPTAGLARARDSFLVEPGVIVEWSPHKLLTLNTNQLLVLDAALNEGADLALYYAGSFSASVRLWRVSLAAELTTAFGLNDAAGPEPARALALGGAARLHLDRFRVSLQAGGGLNDDGRAMVGRFTAGLALDVGFDWPR